MELERALKNNRIFRAITGVTPEEFKRLLPIFTQILIETAMSKKDRQRAYGGGRKGNIKEESKKLFFILVYLKIYPTYDLLAYMFDSSRTRVFNRVHDYYLLDYGIYIYKNNHIKYKNRVKNHSIFLK